MIPMAFFTHDGIRFHFEQLGAGTTTFAFSHKLSSCVDDMRTLLDAPEGYSLVLWDARGHGETTQVGPPDKFTFSHFANDLYALISHLEIKHAVFGGVSRGREFQPVLRSIGLIRYVVWYLSVPIG